MSEYIYPEPQLRHIARNRVGLPDTGDVTITPRNARKRRTAASVRKNSAPAPPAGSGNPFTSDDRVRHTTAVVLLLAALLLLLAIVSYTPLDQANADLGLRDMLKVFTNDPAVTARAAGTKNWLGLVGAFVATVLINGTFGYASVAFPGLMGLWSWAVYRNNDYKKAKRISLFTLILATTFAAVCGTVQLVLWLPHPAHEWSGGVGAFLASVMSGLIGSAGAFLVLLAATLITLIYAVNLNIASVTTLIAKQSRRLWNALVFRVDQALARYNLRAAVAGSAGNQAPGTDPASAAGTDDPRILRTKAAPADNEPAQMVRGIQSRQNGQRLTTGVRSLRDTLMNAARESFASVRKPFDHKHIQEKFAAEDAASASAITPATAEPVVSHNQTTTAVPPTPPHPTLTAPARLQQQVAPEPLITKHPEQPVAQPTDKPQPALHLDVTEAQTEQEVKDAGSLIEKTRDEQIVYTPPSVDMLEASVEQSDVDDNELKMNARLLQEKLATFNIQIENLTVTPGPVVTLYEFIPAAGIKISRIEALADDIALAIKARGIRIIAPIPGKGTVGIEIPNHKPAMVRIRSVLNTVKFRESHFKLPLALGKTTVGEVYCDDLSKMPHLLIAGATGAGKSVGVNALITSLIYKIHPADLKFVIIDPKKIELTQYRALTHHFLAVSPDIDEQIITSPANAVLVLKSLELEMERRYDILARVGQRNIADYNQKVAEGRYRETQDFDHRKLPYIVVVIDELADLMITAAREVEEPIARLAQLARAVGLHLVVATQRPSVDVITGMIKANFPARIAYQVASKVDSRTILDANGAEQLLGQGDMLYLPAGQPKPIRLQNAFISTEEVESICDYIGDQTGYTTPYMLPSVADKNKKSGAAVNADRDELFDEAARLVVRHQQGSVSMLQRRMKVGYSRAARIMDELEMAGIVGAFDGSKSRAVMLESEAELEAYL